MTEQGLDRQRLTELLFVMVATYLAVMIHPLLAGVVIWYIILKGLERAGVLDRWNATRVMGIVLMVRTKRGQRVLEAVSRPRLFWRVFGELGLWTCRAISLLVMLLVVLAMLGTLFIPQEIEPPPARELIGLPGMHPAIPLGWGLAGLIIALVIHEYGHGVLARAHGMRVRSFGLLILGLIPIGAFAEPEGEELMRAPRKERQRVFAAGPAVNIYASFLGFLLLAAVASQFIAADPGIHATGIIEDEPAHAAGLEAWEIITHMNGTPVRDYAEFGEVIDEYSAGDQVNLTVLSVPDANGEREQRTVSVVLSNKHTYYVDSCVETEGCDVEAVEAWLEAQGVVSGDPFLGVSGVSSSTVGTERLAGPLSDSWPEGKLAAAIGFGVQPMTLLFMPIQTSGEVMYVEELDMLSVPDDGLAGMLGMSGMVILLHMLFWFIWWNIVLGAFNLIPLVPFDGGHMMRDWMHDQLSRLSAMSRDWHPMRVERLAHKMSAWSSFTVLAMLLIMIFLPYLRVL
uniref:Putative peptidase M50 family n=1 Tax=uncultured marine group II/III euryarchaeote KM3_05_H10 TaxID=1457839 RepID=A0A075G9Z1_9EURY|nr:putative peptidase M50 family [uncultured marine group II/III euryarchaeote KM3_05_H10]